MPGFFGSIMEIQACGMLKGRAPSPHFQLRESSDNLQAKVASAVVIAVHCKSTRGTVVDLVSTNVIEAPALAARLGSVLLTDDVNVATHGFRVAKETLAETTVRQLKHLACDGMTKRRAFHHLRHLEGGDEDVFESLAQEGARATLKVVNLVAEAETQDGAARPKVLLGFRRDVGRVAQGPELVVPECVLGR